MLICYLKAFNIWKQTNICPYANIKIQRCCNFKEQIELWEPELLNTPALSAYELMVLILKEKCKYD